MNDAPGTPAASGGSSPEADLTLMLMLLSSWTEKGADMPRCWKGYSFHVLDELEESDLIRTSRSAKSAHLTPEGVARARDLLQAHLFLVPEDRATAR